MIGFFKDFQIPEASSKRLMTVDLSVPYNDDDNNYYQQIQLEQKPIESS